MAQVFSFQNYGLFNAQYYLQQNPDVATGWTGTPLQHYIQYGALEGRAPTAWFDADYYRASYQDLQSMNALQLFNHYCNYGYNEGRQPMLNFANFNGARYLVDNPDVLAAGYTAANAISHFVAYGEYEGRAAYANNGVVIEPVVNIGDTFALTTSIDNILGTQFNDTFNASIGSIGADPANTLQNFDSIDGAGGVDTLNALLVGTGPVVTPSKLANLEIINATAVGGPASLNVRNALQLDVVNNSGSDDNLTVSGIVAGVALGVTDVSADTVFNYAVTTGTQTVDLTVSNVSNLGDTVDGSGHIYIAGVETINVTSNSVPNDIDLIDQTGSLKTINVAGEGDLDLNIVQASVTTLDATGFVGDLDANVSNQVSNGTTATVVKGGLGDDVFTTTATAGVATIASSLNGGLGQDSLVFVSNGTLTPATLINANSINITSIENVDVVQLDNATTGAVTAQALDASLVGGLNTVNFYARDLNAENQLTVTNLAATNQTVNVAEVGTGTGSAKVTVGLSNIVGTADAANVALTTAAGTANQISVAQVAVGSVVNGIEALNLSVNAQTYGDVEVAGTFGTLNVTGGAAGKGLTLGTHTPLTNATINASGLASNLTANIGAVNVSATGGSGADTFNFGANLSTFDTVNGGAGTNTVGYTTTTGINAANLTNIQTLNVTGATGVAASTFNGANSNAISTVYVTYNTSNYAEALTFSNMNSASYNVQNAGSSAAALTISAPTAASTDVTVNYGFATVTSTTAGALTANNAGSLTINGTATDPGATGAAVRSDTIGAVTTNATSLRIQNGVGSDLSTGDVIADSALDLTLNATGDIAVATQRQLYLGSAAIHADKALDVTVRASGNGLVDEASAQKVLRNLTVDARTGGEAAFTATVTPAATANLDIHSLTVTTGDSPAVLGSLVGADSATGIITQASIGTTTLHANLDSFTVNNGALSTAVGTATLIGGAASYASVGSIDLTNGAGGSLTATASLSAGTASIDTININNVAGPATLNVTLDSSATGAASAIGTLTANTTATGLTTLSLTGSVASGHDSSIDVNGGNIGGAGNLTIKTTYLTAIDLHNVGTTGMSGALTVAAQDANLVDVTGTNYGETVTLNAAAHASTVQGNGGSDKITLATGDYTDNLVYAAQSDSTGTVYDYATNFKTSGSHEDVIDLSALQLTGAAFETTAANATVTYTSATNVTFTVAPSAAVGFFTNAGDARVALDLVGASEAAVVFVDANHNGNWDAAGDMAIVLIGDYSSNTLAAGNFNFG